MQHVHIESYRENGLFFSTTPFLHTSSAWFLPRYIVYFTDVVMWFPPILSRVEYPMRPELSCPKLDNTTAWPPFPSDKQPGQHLALLQLPMLGGLSSKLCISLGVASPCCFGHTIRVECSARLEA